MPVLTDPSAVPFDIILMVIRFLSVRDRVRASRTSRTFYEAVDFMWCQEKEIPDLSPIPDAAMAGIVSKCYNTRVVDFDVLSPAALALVSAPDLASSSRRIACFKSVHLKHLSFISQYVRALRLPAQEVPVECMELILDDWQLETPHLYEHMSQIIDSCGRLQVMRIENSSYGLLRGHEIWNLIGSRVTSLDISCPYISVISVFTPGASLQRVTSSFTQSDFDFLCDCCPALEELEETTFFREPLPDYEAVVAVQSDPSSDSDLILDLQPLRKLTNIKHLTLTSLISPSSRLQLAQFLALRGPQLQSLDLNLSNGPIDVLSSVFKCCNRLQRLVLFFDCRSAGCSVQQLTADVEQYAASAAIRPVLLFRNVRKTDHLLPQLF